MNQVKSRLAALALLDRSFKSTSDEELGRAIEQLSEDLLTAFDHVVGYRAEDADSDRVAVTREAVAKGRMNGTLEKVCAVLSDTCLADCITALGDHAENPSLEELTDVMPGLLELHGLGVTRMMLASAVVGEAPASPACVTLLRDDERYALPPVEVTEAKALRPEVADDDEREAVKARRKADKQRKQAEQRARREQAARAKQR
ncbi:MAG: hypothetical protein R2715_02425 [Ilumatobacteraceae bacterium]